MTTPGIVVAVIIAIAGFIFRYFVNHELPWNDLRSVLIPAIWTACAVGFFCVIKAAQVLRDEDLAQWNSWKPIVIGKVPKPPKPSILAVAIPTTFACVLLTAAFCGTLVLPKPTAQTYASDPAIRLEPEHGTLASVTGSFMLAIVNNGVDVDHIWVTRNYFVAQFDGRRPLIKNVLVLACGPDRTKDILPLEFKPSTDFAGTIDGSAIPISVNQVGPPTNVVLRANQRFEVAVTYAGWVKLAYQTAKASFTGNTILGIRILVVFKRFSDQKDFNIVRVLGISEDDSTKNIWSLSVPGFSVVKPPRSTAFTIEDAVPYVTSTDQWSGLRVNYKGGKPVSAN
jgi:hypothetical protein